MQGNASEKIKGGKLIRVCVDFDTAISKVTITGDFFLHPEDSLELIESSLAGLPTSVHEEELRNRIERVAELNQITMVGITSDAIAMLVKQVVSHG